MIAIKSNKELKTPERVSQEGFITREIDFFQINPKTNELTIRITEKCEDKDGNLLWTTTFIPDTQIVPEEMLAPIYEQFRQNLKIQTEKEKLFGSVEGDFDTVNT